MSGSLIKLQETIISSSTASVTLGGSYWDSSYDVYMIKVINAKPVNDNVSFQARVTKDVAGTPTPQTTANYDEAKRRLDCTVAFSGQANTNMTYWTNHTAIGNATSECANGTYYLFNFNNASEYSFLTVEGTDIAYTGNNIGYQGGGIYTVAEAHNGLNMLFGGSSDIASGKFQLFGLKK